MPPVDGGRSLHQQSLLDQAACSRHQVLVFNYFMGFHTKDGGSSIFLDYPISCGPFFNLSPTKALHFLLAATNRTVQQWFVSCSLSWKIKVCIYVQEKNIYTIFLSLNPLYF